MYFPEIKSLIASVVAVLLFWRFTCAIFIEVEEFVFVEIEPGDVVNVWEVSSAEGGKLDELGFEVVIFVFIILNVMLRYLWS